MSVTYLETSGDLRWLRDVHNIPDACLFAAAILYGNEDDPDKVELYRDNHWKCVPVVYQRNTDGILAEVR